MGNSHLPSDKTVSVTATIVYVIFGFYHLICIFRSFFADGPKKCCYFRNFRNFRWFCKQETLVL